LKDSYCYIRRKTERWECERNRKKERKKEEGRRGVAERREKEREISEDTTSGNYVPKIDISEFS